MTIPLANRTTYREAFGHDHSFQATPNSSSRDLDSDTFNVKTTIRNRELEVSAGPLGPGLTLSTYRDAYCGPYLDGSSQVSIHGAGATRALAGARPPGGTAAFGGPIGRPTEFPPVPRTETFGPGGTTGREITGSVSASPFYSRTTYRDSFSDPFQAANGPMLGMGVSTGDGIGPGTRSVYVTPGLTRNLRRPPAPKVDEAQRTRTAGFKRSLNYSRTTYRDAFGVPFPIVTVDGSENEGRPVTAAPTRSVELGETQDPRWPTETAGTN
jgi:hypothetical protein